MLKDPLFWLILIFVIVIVTILVVAALFDNTPVPFGEYFLVISNIGGVSRVKRNHKMWIALIAAITCGIIFTFLFTMDSEKSSFMGTISELEAYTELE